LVLYNGSVVIEAHTGVILARSAISAVAFSQIMRLRAALGSTLYAYSGPDEWPTSLESVEEVCGWNDQSPSPAYDINGARVRWNPEVMEGSILPVAVLMDLPREPKMRAEALARLRRIAGLSLTTSVGPFVEIRPEGSNKAVGLQVAIDHLGVRQEHVLALGDSDNDAEMLRWAGLAVSVRDATSAALAQSDYVTRKGAAQGALEVLHAIKHARRWFPLVQKAS
jgi:HAD superfamily hydrolase (TIGR01484 family)